MSVTTAENAAVSMAENPVFGPSGVSRSSSALYGRGKGLVDLPRLEKGQVRATSVRTQSALSLAFIGAHNRCMLGAYWLANMPTHCVVPSRQASGGLPPERPSGRASVASMAACEAVRSAPEGGAEHG